MHSSRMCTILERRGVCLGGCLPGQVSAYGGYLNRGVYPGGVYSGGVHLLPIACWDTLPTVDRILDTCLYKHNLPATTVVGGNKRQISMKIFAFTFTFARSEYSLNLKLGITSVLTSLDYIKFDSSKLLCLTSIDFFLSYDRELVLTVFDRWDLYFRYIGIFHILSVFIVLGIGADDVFVFCDTWKETGQSKYKSLAHRLSDAYRWLPHY